MAVYKISNLEPKSYTLHYDWSIDVYQMVSIALHLHLHGGAMYVQVVYHSVDQAIENDRHEIHPTKIQAVVCWGRPVHLRNLHNLWKRI